MERIKKLLKSSGGMGLRIVKTGIAATLCVVVSYWLMLDTPFFAVSTTVISMGKSIDISIRGGKNRIVGAAIGAALYLCHVLKLNGGAPLACIIFTIVVLYRGSDPWFYAGQRCLEVLIGVAIALLVNIIIMPPNYVAQIKRAYADLRGLVEESIDFVSTGDPIDILAINQTIRALSTAVEHYIGEIKFFRGNDEEVFQISCKIATYRQILHELTSIDELGQRPIPKDSPLYPVFSYHLERLIALYDSCRKHNFIRNRPHTPKQFFEAWGRFFKYVLPQRLRACIPNVRFATAGRWPPYPPLKRWNR